VILDVPVAIIEMVALRKVEAVAGERDSADRQDLLAACILGKGHAVTVIERP
jgi:hypothetical protein